MIHGEFHPLETRCHFLPKQPTMRMGSPADAVELHIRGSKTDQRKQGCRRMQQASGDPILCPVRCMVEWFALTEGSFIPATAPLFSIPHGRDGSEWRVLTRETVTLLMKGAAVDCGLKPKHVATHSIRISGATALLIAGVPSGSGENNGSLDQ